MEKRHQVFVSSTYTDLKQERGVVIETLLRLKFMPAGMELFPATNSSSWDWIKRVIEESDYYLVIVGGRYGSIHKDTGLSYTEMEYRYAVEKDRPTIAFLPKSPNSIPTSRCESTQVKKKKLKAFCRYIEGQRNYATYSSPADLGLKVSHGIQQLQSDNPAAGWVKADTIGPQISPAELLSVYRENAVLRDQLNKTGNSPLGMAFDSSIDPLVGTVWSFRGVQRQELNVFTFEGDGSVRCKTKYSNAKWRRLDDDAILFSYGVESSYIVFKSAGGPSNLMIGYHSNGRQRSLRRIS